MYPPLRSHQEIIINASLEYVWDFNQDLTRIADFHPRVDKVTLVSNQPIRGEGISYQCHLNDGKNTCVEKDIKIIPYRKIVTVIPSDTMGLSKFFPDYTVETLFTQLAANTTKMEFSHYYSIRNIFIALINLFAKAKIHRDSRATLQGIKSVIESEVIEL